MSDHVIYTKPLMVTDEKLKAAIEKQVKQRALKEALDKQIEQTRRCKLQEKRSNVDVSEERSTRRYSFDYENGCGKFALCDNDTEFSGVPPMPPTGQKRKFIPPAPPRPLYQSNSLPPNFAMSTSESNPLAPKRSEYNTNSLPVNLELLQANSHINANENVNSRVPPPHRKEAFAQVISSRDRDSQRRGEYQTNCLPRNFNLNDVKTLYQLQQQQKTPQTSLEVGHVSPRNPLDLSPSRSPRRLGGPLPPLEVVDGGNAKRTSEHAKLAVSPRSRMVAHGGGGGGGDGGGGDVPVESRDPKPKQLPLRGRSKESRVRPNVASPGAGPVGVGAGAVPRNNVAPTRMTGNKVELLQKQLESREFEMAKMREKERNWEEQVKQLKIELKNAKRKERDLNKLVNGRPRRAETAPDQPILSTPVIPNVPPKKNGMGPSPLVLGGKRQDFTKSGIFQPNVFRPISAPSESLASSRQSTMGRTRLPPLQESFKLASALTCKTAFGLPERNARRPVPIEYEHLLQFVEAQIITHQQADELWKLFANEESPLALLRRGSAPVAPAAQGSTEPAVIQRDLCLSRKRSEEQETTREDYSSEGAVEEVDLEDVDEYDENNETYETYAELVLDEHLSHEDPTEYSLDHLDE